MVRVTRKKGVNGGRATSPAAANPSGSAVVSAEADFSGMSVTELIANIMQLNKDPVIGQMLAAFADKIPKEFAETVEKEKRMRSIVLAGVEESEVAFPPSRRQMELEDKVAQILDVLDVECRPSEVFRMGNYDETKPRLVKVVLPSTSYWRKALANARKLRGTGFANIFLRRSMTLEERNRDYELRQLAKERNKGKNTKEWVVYIGELKQISELPSRKSGNA